MAAQAKKDDAILFHGRLQPDPAIRLDQVKMFLSDEDCHRCLGFKEKLLDIVEYVRHLRKHKHNGQEQLVKEIEEMIEVHKTWIIRTEPKPISYHFTRLFLTNRLLGLIPDTVKRDEILNTKAPPISQSLNVGPSIHKRMEDKDRPASPDPFLYTKALADVRRQQDAEAAVRRGLHGTNDDCYLREPANFNGPYAKAFIKTAQEVQEVLVALGRVVRRLDIENQQGSRPMIKKVLEKINSIKDTMLDLSQVSKRPTWTTANKDIDKLLTLINASDLTNAGYSETELVTVESLVGGRFELSAVRHGERMQFLIAVLARAKTDPTIVTMERIPSIFPGGVSADNISRPLLAKIAAPLAMPNMDLNEITAARLLQEQVIQESSSNYSPREPNFAKIWAFGAAKNTQNFFSLDRWPLELQTKSQQDEIKSSGPQPRRKQRRLPARIIEALDNEDFIMPRDDVMTVQVDGETFYPFGETLEEQHLLSRRLERDLENVPGYSNPSYNAGSGQHVLQNPAPDAPAPTPIIFSSAAPHLPSVPPSTGGSVASSDGSSLPGTRLTALPQSKRAGATQMQRAGSQKKARMGSIGFILKPAWRIPPLVAEIESDSESSEEE